MNWELPRPFVWRVTVRAEHVDGLHHANNAEYVRWCESAGWAHSAALGLDVTNYQGLDRGMAIRHAEYDYILAAREGDELLFGTWLTRVDGRINMTRRFQVLRAGDEALILRAQWQMVCIELSSGKPRRMPDIFKEVYSPAVIAPEAESERRICQPDPEYRRP
ncbi:acyl-CoA thioesterase [Microbulbifer thermotolerans]|uniref:acyl-CoA thioesterase n=1 Tax=Microbulbifer thermotolerans TaxID=252514 RepID=UPI00224AC009|nr:thioesterase family protein [Microbulbifer thermotolerans]MCX2783642.1 acyl-CoA thioesterase [Microbulbifer thermotolerans]MCX2836182.1 acyl-CoA thioesterase [Microbulbifer thermotolerans]